MKNSGIRYTLSISLSLLFVLFFYACEKNGTRQSSDDARFPSKLYGVNSVIVQTKIYSRNGEVTDPLLRAAAFESTGLNFNTRQKNYSLVGDSSIVIQFRSRDQFLLGNDPYPYTIKKTDSLFKFASTNASVGWVPPTADHWGVFMHQFYKYPQFIRTSDTSVLNRKQFSGYGNYEKISLRGLDLGLIRRDSVTKAIIIRSYTSSFNEFDTASLKYLGKYDTVAARRVDVNYSR